MKNSHLIQRAAALALAAVMAVMTPDAAQRNRRMAPQRGQRTVQNKQGMRTREPRTSQRGVTWSRRLHIRLKLERNVLWISSRTRTGSW